LNKELVLKCISVNRTNWVLSNGNETYLARLDKFYNENSFPIVGDNVKAYFNEWNECFISDICERKNVLSRMDNGEKQLMASNIDVIFIVSSMNNDFNIAKLERLAIIANIDKARLCFVLTKKDLCDDPLKFIDIVRKRFMTDLVFATDATRNDGIEALLNVWNEGECAIFIGSSGVGKSTIVNALAKKELMKTGSIREKDSRGRHTTVSRNLFYIDNNRSVIDTAGIRAVGVSSIEKNDEINSLFEEIVEIEKACRYKDCTHTHEKDCAVKEAINKGILSYDTVKRYIKLKNKKKARIEMNQNKSNDVPAWIKESITKKKKKSSY